MSPLFRRTTRRNTDRAQPWGQAKLALALIGVAVAVVSLLVGLGVATKYAIDNAADPANSSTDPQAVDEEYRPAEPVGSVDQARGERARTAIGAEPMLDTDTTDYRPQEPSTTPAKTITIPPSTGAGPADVPNGFPRTPAGAVGQLAAIETTVLQAMDIRAATTVYQAWARPGGVGAPQWELTKNVATFLGATNQQTRKEATTVVVATPVAAQVKGVDGPGWVVACVLLQVRATAQAHAEVGYGHCEQMVWDTGSGRWMIAAGEPPTTAPSTWPGTDLARRAGWLDWVPGKPTS